MSSPASGRRRWPEAEVTHAARPITSASWSANLAPPNCPRATAGLESGPCGPLTTTWRARSRCRHSPSSSDFHDPQPQVGTSSAVLCHPEPETWNRKPGTGSLYGSYRDTMFVF